MSIARFPSGLLQSESTSCCICSEPITRQEATFGPAADDPMPRLMCATHLAEGRHLITVLTNYYHKAAATPYQADRDGSE